MRTETFMWRKKEKTKKGKRIEQNRKNKKKKKETLFGFKFMHKKNI